jgi:hypothetical protein
MLKILILKWAHPTRAMTHSKNIWVKMKYKDTCIVLQIWNQINVLGKLFLRHTMKNMVEETILKKFRKILIQHPQGKWPDHD